jgi:flagellar biosynthesis chaperone FliJ
MMQNKTYIQQAKERAKAEINALKDFISRCNEIVKQQQQAIKAHEKRIERIKSDFKKEFGQELN